ncbi:MAG: hydroxymethylbilane synthase [Candidatus Kapabacteria bacterium]|jgi:hydroxymethylbilane synthase|nr:hydroxymethylbilane synthase [Candidatus Kapabacteria bacterium]
MTEKQKVIIGTRSSELALWQANFIKQQIENLFPETEVELKLVKTKGDIILDKALDKIDGKGLFTKELENLLLDGTIDLAVHSLKDMQTEMPNGLLLAAVSKRHKVNDGLLARRQGMTIEDLPQNAIVATGSTRRRAQLLNLRPDIKTLDLRGNVNTRIKKFLDSNWDAVILACAGLERINLQQHISSEIDVNTMLPAVGQGALGIQINQNNEQLIEICTKLNHQPTFLETSAERAFLTALGGGCKTPIAAYATTKDSILHISGLVSSGDGRKQVKIDAKGNPEDAVKIGKKLASDLLTAGADEIIKNDFN